MNRSLISTCAALAVLTCAAGAEAQERRFNGYLKFFGGMSEPVSKRTNAAVPSGFGTEFLTGLRDDFDQTPEPLDQDDFAALFGAEEELADRLSNRRVDTSTGYGGGIIAGLSVSPRLAVEFELAHRTHDIENGTSEDLFEANRAAFTDALLDIGAPGAFTAPTVIEPDGETTIAVTTAMVNTIYSFHNRSAVTPYAGLGLGWASPAGDISDYDGNLAYQLRAGADVALGPVLVGVQGTYLGAGDFDSALGRLSPDLADPSVEPFGDEGQSSVEYGTAEVALTVTVPLGR